MSSEALATHTSHEILATTHMSQAPTMPDMTTRLSQHATSFMSTAVDMHEQAAKKLSHHVGGHRNASMAIVACGFGILVLLLMICCSQMCRNRERKPRPSARHSMPAFDLEGSSGSGSADGSLHVSIVQAAANADVAALRTWLGASTSSLPRLAGLCLSASNLHAHTCACAMSCCAADESCNVNATMGDGSTALHHAARAGHANVVRLLLDGGADVLCVDAQLRTPLHLGAMEGGGCTVHRTE